MNEILEYFPNITDEQRSQMEMLRPLYCEWNSKINVISRKDIENIYSHHVLHSLAIAKETRFTHGSRILDFGTGGGFPGIPLAIMFPDCHFKLIDRTGKKIKVVNEVACSLGLKNIEAEQISGEEEKGKYDFVVSRAVMPLPDLMKIIKKNISDKQRNAIANGLLCLKGGNIDSEIHNYRHISQITDISKIFRGEWFKNKYVIYIPI
ncbi:MAG: 16S rRNA (guanine(527)-N(7))-methyltransferase RsmG [Prevotella sp. AG:487_50_53]|jgi:16S rRNA (guanine527-N7)-methyltransferase|uniref:Ribosomal RNA small subunit methyltransferase G n=1 Tax=Leyella lascolaii TaxID=1776379 RepID=A0AAW7JVS0_9BACT|nr:16S rRNA (guanine(527)-N(7))-methyltransferase RsmG [Leyella lascolaii]MDN0022581.1 16S rRNA (guanine(527)-N(7))-methyltransferase RsmG [Leyella lascolaii]MDN0025422.1 16S rRNA (guanine(527)-N(7))-methyltransferase RsmG [Leyella lascolaii]OKZ28024.1 MAG: 16S rRNA (guanine(527)-N(7))-methyltransferase RsmG [Prevotella sp. AG:487_50_53]CCZ15152.1 ribosomal RNA small subunit methyltransferase G [Prevotella sp. CAG:487]